MKEWLYRALRTFLQSFCGVIAGNVALLSTIDFNAGDWWKLVLIDLLIPAVSGGLSAVMNLEKTK